MNIETRKQGGWVGGEEHTGESAEWASFGTGREKESERKEEGRETKGYKSG